MSLGPYGYTVTIWTSGGVLIHARGAPSAIEALLFMLGAVAGYATVATTAFGSLRARVIVDPPPPAIWAGFHVVGIGLAGPWDGSRVEAQRGQQDRPQGGIGVVRHSALDRG